MNSSAQNLENTITYHYEFRYGDGAITEFDVKLDRETLSLVTKDDSTYPRWTDLEYCKCPHCPLDTDQARACPIAACLADLIAEFCDSVSYERAEITISTDARTYAKHTDLQQGISSLIGLYMATGGCPVMEWLKPMAYSHLPFATPEETTYRVASMYMLAQHFIARQGGEPDWELSGLAKIYDDIRLVNQSFVKRLRAAAQADAGCNALVKLDIFASHVTFLLNTRMLDEMAPFFSAYIKDIAGDGQARSAIRAQPGQHL